MRALWGLVTLPAAVLLALLLCCLTDGDGSSTAPGSSSVSVEGGTFELGDQPRTPRPSVSPQQMKAARRQPYIVIDRYCNRIYLRTRDSVLLDALCSTGSSGGLVDSTTGRHWKFDTPPGVYVVHSKIENPWWRKPDWAFVEEGEPIPARESERMDSNMMGDYAIGFGDGYFIHGTIYERLLGRAVTHGCVRMAAADLKVLYDRVHVGTLIFVF